MFTLIPQQNKRALAKQYRIRLLIVFLFFASAVVCGGTLLLLPSYISVSFDKSIKQNELNPVLAQIEAKNKQGLTSTLAQMQTSLVLIRPEDGALHDAFEAINNHLAPGISIKSITYTRGVGAPSSFSVTGTASTREKLLAFVDALKTEKIFTSVNLPISDLAKQTDTPYSISLLGTF